ncbi:N-acetyltransferase family protein [Paracoccaceae bacterium GXU_MW_L88]
MVSIRAYRASDGDALWSVLEPVYREGATYCIPRDISRDAALADWCDGWTVLIAEEDGAVLGTAHYGANRPGGGAHVANASFATAPAARGKGVAQGLLDAVLEGATADGFRAMQFNFVVSTNQGAIRLWERAGFETLCRLPEAFDHPDHGYVDALVMFRKLNGGTDGS